MDTKKIPDFCTKFKKSLTCPWLSNVSDQWTTCSIFYKCKNTKRFSFFNKPGISWKCLLFILFPLRKIKNEKFSFIFIFICWKKSKKKNATAAHNSCVNPRVSSVTAILDFYPHWAIVSNIEPSTKNLEKNYQ